MITVTTTLLFVSRNLPPLIGGMEKLNYQAYLAFQKVYSLAVCGPEGAGRFLADATQYREIPAAPLFRFLIGCQWESFKLARRFRPQFVYSGSGLTAPAALMAARSVGAGTICFLHGLDIVVDHPVYQKLFLPAIRQFDCILVNSSHTASLAEAAGVGAGRIKIIHPGVDLPDWQSRAVARLRFRKRFQLGEQAVLLAAGRLTQRKGLVEFIRYALPEITRQVPGIRLLIIGDEATSALKHRDGVRNRIQVVTQELGLEGCVSLLGAVDDACLSDAYFASDAMVFPVLDLPGDVEGFGMVAVEAAAHGLPTIAFAVGGVPDAVADGVSGFLVRPGDVSEMVARTVSVFARPNEHWNERCRVHAERFAWDIFKQKLTSIVGRC